MTPEDKEPLDKKIIDWLGTKGYGLEYRTYKAFTDAGIRSFLGQHLEAENGVRREIDVAGSVGSKTDEMKVGIFAFCECKYSQSAWIIMTSDLTSGFLADWGSIPQSHSVVCLYPEIPPMRRKLETCWHFAKDQVFGHTLLEFKPKSSDGKQDNRDAAFDSLQKIANAAWDHSEKHQDEIDTPIMTFPCLIVGARLFEGSYDYEAEQFKVKEIPYGRLSWTGCHDCTVVDVVNIAHIAEYAKLLANTMNTIHGLLEPLAPARDLSDIE